MSRSSLASSRPSLYLHVFVEGSGERTLLRYLHENALQTGGGVYPFAINDFVSGLPFHVAVKDIVFRAITVNSQEERRFFTSLLTDFWRRIAEAFKERDKIFLSLGCFPFSWDMFWKVGAGVLDFSRFAVQPLITLLPQEDYMESFYRGQAWHHATAAPLQPRAEICDYALMCDTFRERAGAHGVALEPERVFWKSPAEDGERRIAEQVLECCGMTASWGTLPPDSLFLRAYDTLRFSGLAFPAAHTGAFHTLGVRPRFPGNLWKTDETRACCAALREGERRGTFSLRPLSDAALRRRAHELGREGNEKLGRRFPELQDVMKEPPRYPADMAGEEPHELNGERIDRCLDLLSREQRSWVAHCLDNEFIELTEEQREIRSRLQQPVTPAFSDEEYDISVLTMAYNQREYIARTIESVLAQQCSYKVQHIIVDDGSDDGTQDIIASYARRYPQIKPFFLHRFYKPVAANVQMLFGHCRTKYAALCDGDDYFSDPLKLQKQVDFLERHPDFSICFHPVDVIYKDGSPSRVYPTEDILPGGVREAYTLEDLLSRNFIQTNAAVYRWRFREGLPDWFACDLVPGDWYWHVLHAETGKIAYLEEHMSVYWRHTASFYASAEGSHVDHRKVHGLQELHVYDVLNRHFHGRYYGSLCRLAMGVLADFMQAYMATGDDSLLQLASAKYPNFTRSFLSRIKRDMRVRGGR